MVSLRKAVKPRIISTKPGPCGNDQSRIVFHFTRRSLPLVNNAESDRCAVPLDACISP
jgi:hypothetical protein